MKCSRRFIVAVTVGSLSLALPAHPRAQPGRLKIEPWKNAALFGAEFAHVDGNGRVHNSDPAKPAHARSNRTLKLTGFATICGDALSARKIEKLGINVTVAGIEDDRAGVLTYPGLKAFIDSWRSGNDNACVGITNQGTIPLAGTDFKLQGAEVLHLPPGNYFFTDFRMLGNSQLNIMGPITFYVAGRFEVSAQARLNPAGSPCDLRILSNSDAPKMGLYFIGRSVSKALVYSMRGEVEVIGDAELFGSVSARVAKVAGNGKVHYPPCAARKPVPVPALPPGQPGQQPQPPARGSALDEEPGGHSHAIEAPTETSDGAKLFAQPR